MKKGEAMRTSILKSVVVCLIMLNSLSGAKEKQLLGFNSKGASDELTLERRLGVALPKRMNEYHLIMTAEPHHAGTEANIKIGHYYAEKLKEFGFDEVQTSHYEVLLPRPIERSVTLISPERYELKLVEPPYDEDQDLTKDGVLPPYNAYAADGDITGEIVFVNYGLPEDYKVLDSLGVSVRGKIVLAKYGRSWRGIKPKIASEHGAIGCLIYSDPEDDGFVQGEVMPKGKWRPEWGVQRGSVMDMPTYPGDPLTPFQAAKGDVKRLPLDKVPTLQKIPVLPISYGDALPILRNIEGPIAPDSWKGGLAITYHIGPGPAEVHMKLKSDWSLRTIMNVIGILRGSEEPEKIVMVGSHRDAWTFGGRDPISGATVLLETGKLLGDLAKKGYRPKRSIAIASWDGEEYGLIGSVEYGEEFAETLKNNVVVYLNRESYTAGNFSASGVHSLQPFINQLTKDINMPGSQGTVYDSWKENSNENRLIKHNGYENVRLGALGSGSDYTVFLDHLGIPSINLGFGSGNGIYHSRYDTHWFFTQYGDPGFVYGIALTDLVAKFLLRMANSTVYPFDYSSTAETIHQYIDEVEKESEDRNVAKHLNFSSLRKSTEILHATS
ncbi:MAG TPA: M28 family peptidase, partial [Candidatus Marinimicrobia bacterium]|nr:M28 family peptidase [Candidatus Neomarinimicrobiota bacterium]